MARAGGCLGDPGRPAPFFAVIDMLRLYFEVSPGEAKDSIRDKIARRLALVDETLMRSLPAFLTLFDVPVDDAGGRHSIHRSGAARS
jgi:hypothetical protein